MEILRFINEHAIVIASILFGTGMTLLLWSANRILKKKD